MSVEDIKTRWTDRALITEAEVTWASLFIYET